MDFINKFTFSKTSKKKSYTDGTVLPMETSNSFNLIFWVVILILSIAIMFGIYKGIEYGATEITTLHHHHSNYYKPTIAH